jgi:hypothetical protein
MSMSRKTPADVSSTRVPAPVSLLLFTGALILCGRILPALF